MTPLNLLDPHWLTAAFTFTNVVRALFYVPQVVAVARSVDGARDIALSTWWMWAINNSLGALYTGMVMNHAILALSFWASAAACLLTIGLALRARRRLAYAPDLRMRVLQPRPCVLRGARRFVPVLRFGAHHVGVSRESPVRG